MSDKLRDINAYFIGGSPCCGKSSISEMLAEEFGFEIYKCDDHLDRYADIGAERGSEIMKKIKSMTLDELWLRDVQKQVEDEFLFYRDALKIIRSDIIENYRGKTVIVEGAAILPEFILEEGIRKSRYICMVPTQGFQLDHYSRRSWVQSYLEGCSDKNTAFRNWMQRDAEFAEIIKDQARRNDLNLMVVDGEKSLHENYMQVRQMMGLIKNEFKM